MKKISVEEAVGMTLCHDITKVIPGKFKGRAFQRNHVIRQEDVAELLKIGKEHVFVWEEHEGEIHEDEAAVRIAEAVKGTNIEYEKPKEGKSILKSTQRGLLKINSSVLYEVNSLDNISVACLPNNYTVEKGQGLAGVRIIPLTIEESVIERLEAICAGEEQVLEVKPYLSKKVGIVTTGNEVFKGLVEDKFAPVLNEKLEYYGAKNLGQIICPDDLEMIKEAIDRFLSKGAEVIILTGGMSVDPDDLTPTAIRRTGAKVITYGVPIQPGNMFMLAYYKDTVMMGVPGAAMYYPTTSLDVVLPRVLAGEVMEKRDFVMMGEGGFCSFCQECTYPRCYFCR